MCLPQHPWHIGHVVLFAAAALELGELEGLENTFDKIKESMGGSLEGIMESISGSLDVDSITGALSGGECRGSSPNVPTSW